MLQIQCDVPQDARQALVMYVLGTRGDTGALPVVLETAKSGAAPVRLAAVRVLAKLGDVSAVPVLLETAVEAQGELAQAAQDSLAELAGDEVDAALVSQLPRSEGQRRLVLIDLAGMRGIASAVPALLKLADDDDQQLRTAAISALGLTVGLDELPALVDRLVDPKSPDVAAAAKEALSKACLRMPDRDACASELIDRMPQASTAAKGALLELLGVVGGPRALEGVSAAAKDADEDVQDAATRVLGEWMNPDAAPVLLELAKTGNEKFKVRTLRGYIRIPRQLDVPPDQRIAMCKKALEAAERDAERKLVLEVLGRNPSAESLKLVVPHLSSPSLKEDASTAAVAIAERIVQTQPAPVAEAMRQVIEVSGDNELLGRAKRLLRRAGR
jgi:HEAT repeat protein